MPSDLIVPVLLAGILGITLGYILMVVLSKLGLNRDQQKAKLILDEANIKAEGMVRQAVLDGKTQVYDLKLAAEKELKEQRRELQDHEQKLSRREDTLNFRDETLTSKEKQIDEKNRQITDKLSNLEKLEKDLQIKLDGQIHELERIANLSAADAKTELFEAVKHKTRNELEAYIRDQEDEARLKAQLGKVIDLEGTPTWGSTRYHRTPVLLVETRGN